MALKNLFSKKKRGLEVTRDEYYKIAEGLPEYKHLEGLIGRLYSSYIVGMIWDKFPKSKDPFTHKPSSMATFNTQISAFLDIEKKNIDSRKRYVNQLWNKATTGSLKGKIPQTNRSKGNPMDEIREACNWMVKSGMDAKLKGNVRTILYENTVLIKTMPPLGRDDHLIVNAHKQIVPGMNKDYRTITLGVNYPSSVGGRYLLRWVLKNKNIVHWPAQGDDKWEDYALFYFGAIGAVQPFKDGNKRISRLAYAITLLRGGMQFKGFSYALQNELLNMSMG